MLRYGAMVHTYVCISPPLSSPALVNIRWGYIGYNGENIQELRGLDNSYNLEVNTEPIVEMAKLCGLAADHHSKVHGGLHPR